MFFSYLMPNLKSEIPGIDGQMDNLCVQNVKYQVYLTSRCLLHLFRCIHSLSKHLHYTVELISFYKETAVKTLMLSVLHICSYFLNLDSLIGSLEVGYNLYFIIICCIFIMLRKQTQINQYFPYFPVQLLTSFPFCRLDIYLSNLSRIVISNIARDKDVMTMLVTCQSVK